MSSLPQLRNGFMKFTRLGPPKLVKQKNNDRAPESYGMWAFPWPYFDHFFTDHRYDKLLPKHLQGGYPRDPEYFRHIDTDEKIKSLEGFGKDEYGFYDDLYVDESWNDERNEWIKTVGRKIEKPKSFWYSGPVYTHIRSDKSISYSLFEILDPHEEWNLTDTHDLYHRILRVGGNRSRQGNVTFRTSVDHLEVFIPKGGRIRSNP